MYSLLRLNPAIYMLRVDDASDSSEWKSREHEHSSMGKLHWTRLLTYYNYAVLELSLCVLLARRSGCRPRRESIRLARVCLNLVMKELL
jgi:hypothetical protein